MEKMTLGFQNRGNRHHNELREFFAKEPSLLEIEAKFFQAPELHGVVTFFNLFSDNVAGNDELILAMFEAIGTTGEPPMPESQNDNFDQTMRVLETDEAKARALLLLDPEYHIKHFVSAITNIVDDEVKIKMLIDTAFDGLFHDAGIAEIKKPRNRHAMSPSFKDKEEQDLYFSEIIAKVKQERAETQPKPLGKEQRKATQPAAE